MKFTCGVFSDSYTCYKKYMFMITFEKEKG